MFSCILLFASFFSLLSNLVSTRLPSRYDIFVAYMQAFNLFARCLHLRMSWRAASFPFFIRDPVRCVQACGISVTDERKLVKLLAYGINEQSTQHTFYNTDTQLCALFTLEMIQIYHLSSYSSFFQLMWYSALTIFSNSCFCSDQNPC